jgi:hypothetical protein
VPQVDPFGEAARDLQEKIAAHAETRSSQRYTDAECHRDRLVRDFLFALRASAIAFTRYPNSRHWLLQNAVGEELIESAVALSVLTSQGIFNAPRRELRFLLEATVKYVYVDQQLPGDASLEERVALLGDKSRVPRSSVAPVADLQMWMLEDPGSLRAAVKQCFAALSGTSIHLNRPARSGCDARSEENSQDSKGPKSWRASTA